MQVWQNTRTINIAFTPGVSLTLDNVTTVATGDFDGDGRIDVVAAATGTGLQIHSQTIDLNFNAPTSLMTTADVSDLAVADVDNDGDLDILVAEGMTNAELFRNDGNGSFTAEGAGFAAEQVRLVDRDGDGYSDVVTTSDASIRSYANDGAGKFSSTGETLIEGGAVHDFELVALDSEGDADLVSVTADATTVRNASRTGTWGTYAYIETEALGSDDSLAIARGDFDGDGDEDIVTANAGPDLVLLNDGDGGFTYSGQAGHTLSPVATMALAVADFDGDGDLDIATGAPAFIGSTIWVNDGAGNFQSGATFAIDEHTLSLAAGDLDGDLDIDLILGNAGANQVWRNDSSGSITLTLRPSQMPFDPDNNDQQTNDMVLADMDGDGDLDLVTANGTRTSGQLNKAYRNNGNGTMSFRRNLPGGSVSSYSLAVADFDGDGDRDVAIGNRSNGTLVRNQVAFAIGNLSFALQAGTFGDGPTDTRGLAAADIDGDGDIDLLAADAGSPSFGSWLNDGTGAFAVDNRIGSHNSSDLIAADFDNDGDTDAVVSNRRGQPNRVYLNR